MAGNRGEAVSDVGRVARSCGRHPAVPGQEERGEVTTHCQSPGGESGRYAHALCEGSGRVQHPAAASAAARSPRRRPRRNAGYRGGPRGRAARPGGSAGPRRSRRRSTGGAARRSPGTCSRQREGGDGGRRGTARRAQERFEVAPPRGTAVLTGGRRCRAPDSVRCHGRYSPLRNSSASFPPRCRSRDPARHGTARLRPLAATTRPLSFLFPIGS